MHFCKAYPSKTGAAIVFVKPVSKTIADERPHAKDESTASLHRKNEGTLYFSKRNSVNFSLKSLLWIEFSVKINGVSFGWSIRLLIKDVLRISSSTSKSTIKVIFAKIESKLTHSIFLVQRLDSHVISFKVEWSRSCKELCFVWFPFHLWVTFFVLFTKFRQNKASHRWYHTSWAIFSTIAYGKMNK